LNTICVDYRIFDDDMSYIDQRKKEEKLIKIMQDEFRNVA